MRAVKFLRDVFYLWTSMISTSMPTLAPWSLPARTPPAHVPAARAPTAPRRAAPTPHACSSSRTPPRRRAAAPVAPPPPPAPRHAVVWGRREHWDEQREERMEWGRIETSGAAWMICAGWSRGAGGWKQGRRGKRSRQCESEGQSRKGRGHGLMADWGNDRRGASDRPDGRALAFSKT